MGFRDYKPPKELRPLFILHYAPLLLIIMLGPLTLFSRIIYNRSFWEMPLPLIPTVIIGFIIFLGGAIFFMKWEIFWDKTYKGQLVTEGFFKYIRHPHYSSLLIIGVGLSLFFYSLLAFIIALIAFPIIIASVLDEEKELLKKYGKEYEDYMKRVRWRLIPGIF